MGKGVINGGIYCFTIVALSVFEVSLNYLFTQIDYWIISSC